MMAWPGGLPWWTSSDDSGHSPVPRRGPMRRFGSSTALKRYASGKSLDPGALGIVEACASLWARCISSASVGPDVAALRGVDAPFLEMVGRSLAERGGFVAALKVEAGAVRLVPASSWDLQGDADPSTWRYRCDFIGPSGSMTETLPAVGVLHFRINADSRTPWRGRSSLSLAVLSGELAARVERALP